jgi:hypothetical protein
MVGLDRDSRVRPWVAAGTIDTDAGNSEEEMAAAITQVLCKWEKRKKKSPCPMDDAGRIEL